MTSNLLEEDVENILGEALDQARETLYVVDPSPAVIEAFVAVTADTEEVPTVRLLADEDVLKYVMDDFIVGSAAADLVEEGTLEMRTLVEDEDNSLLVSAEAVMALVTTGDNVGALVTEDRDFVDAVVAAYDEVWAAAEPYNLRTPAISHVRETLAAEIGEATRDDFDAVLGALETARGNGDGLDEVTISLIVAAKNDVLLYDISKWGEDVGIASKATFSRTKTYLEDVGAIDTEKVPIDVGRPRLRLKLGDGRLVGVAPEELASVTMELLAE
ncbi:Uncharacterized protein AArcCO_0929 [Halalkaliarchaeum sp. AArc-CO]|uniref:transcriptional regulator TbsP n=1 Tax=Halalkaliarchaeum sp. AArc-CO TaxID=2866381 RepID=UPI00217E61F2|nr:DUF5821 family protein [Halalkaliarchaeum sp. AArc-CO]UWG50246.1 Uncharacterized protein AArcCO_0929 [Halalkaliarchaeum sp. AArc-CO]